MTAMRILCALLLVACQHRPIAPATAPDAEAVVPAAVSHPATLPELVLKGFVDIEGICHWTHLDATTGEILQASPLPSQTCPYRAIVTTSLEGTTLMAVRFPEHNELWRQQGTTADVVEIPGHPYLEMAWMESGRVHATTFNFKMDHVFDFPDLDTLPTEPIEEELEDQWHHDCYTYAMTEGNTESEPTWELVREETVELSEGSMRPHCPVGDVAWGSTWNDYAQYSFESFEDSHSYADPGEGMSWGIVYEMDATKSGRPCIHDCDDGELLRRYAFGYMWFEGPIPAGGVMMFDGETWTPLEGLEGEMLEFFLAGDQLILCTGRGFGGWDHATGAPTWWKDTYACPVQERK